MSNLSGFVKRLRDIMRNDAGINGDAQRIEQIAWMLFLKVYDAKEQDWEFDDEGFISIIPEECRWQNWAVDDKSGTAMTGDQLLDFVNNTLFPVLKGKDIKDSDGNVKIKGVKATAETPIKKAIVQTTFADANQYMKDGVLLRQVINVIDELDLSDYEESHAFGEIYESILKELQSAGSAGEFYTPRAVTDFMAQMIQPKIGETMADFACGTGGFIVSWLKELQKQIRSTADAEKYGESIYGIEKKQFPYMLCITNLLLHGLDVPQVFHDNTLLKDVLDYTADDQFDVILMNPPYGGSEKADVKNHFPSDLASSETADLFMSVIMYRLKKNGRAAVILPDGFLFGLDNAKVNLKKKLFKEFNLHTIIRMPSSVFAPYTSIATNILFFDNTHPTDETWIYRMDMPEGYKHFSKSRPMRLDHFNEVINWWNNRHEVSVDGIEKAKRYTAKELIEDFNYNLDLCKYPHTEEIILSPNELVVQYQKERASLNAIVDRSLAEISDCLSSQEIISHTETASGALSRLVEVDNSFPDNMHKSILQFAIQGKLVEPRAEEGTGEDLFRIVQKKKEQLVKNGAIKKDKPLPEITDEEIPFEIPTSWKWVRIQDLFNVRSAMRIHQTDWKTSGIPFFRGRELVQLVKTGTVDFEIYISRELYEANKAKGGVPQKDDLLISAVGTLGKVYVVQGTHEFYYKDAYILCLENIGNVYPKYIKYVLESPYNQTEIHRDSMATTVAQLTIIKTKKLLVPLPPLAEQKRIVAKLEEILPLCERLK